MGCLKLVLWFCLIFCVRIAYCDVIALKENIYEGSLCYLRNSTRGQCRQSCSGLELSEYENNICNSGKTPTLYCCIDGSTAQLYPNIHEACLDRMLAENMYSQLLRTFENRTNRLREIDTVYKERDEAIGEDCIMLFIEIEEDERPSFLEECLKRWSVRSPKIGLANQRRYVRDPSVAGIGINSGDDQNIQWICTGHFITSMIVITSANCIITREDTPNVVRHGRPDLNHFTYKYEEPEAVGSSTYDVLNIVVHDQYDEETSYADIALLKVLRDVSTESRIQLKPLPACLWTRRDVPSANLQFLGYSSILHEGSPFAQNSAVCLINPTRTRGTISCYGCGLKDKTEVVGSILYSEKLEQDIPYLLAIGSGSSPCGINGNALFTYVYPYLEWIENVVSPCSYRTKKQKLRNEYLALVEKTVNDEYQWRLNWTMENLHELLYEHKEFVESCFAEADAIGETEGSYYRVWCESLLSSFIAQINPTNFRIKRYNYPHMAVIGWTNSNSSISWNCAASLVHKSFVLTTARCVLKFGQPPDVVRISDQRLVRGQQDKFSLDYDVERIITHESYESSKLYNDIALLKIKLRGDLGEKPPPLPICIWTKNDYPTRSFRSLGYGSPNYGLSFAFSLRDNNSTLVSNEECETFHRSNVMLPHGLTESQLCATDPEGIIGSCKDESGGPLQFNMVDEIETPYLVGIASFGLQCNRGNPGIYTKIYNFLDWLENKINENVQ